MYRQQRLAKCKSDRTLTVWQRDHGRRFLQELAGHQEMIRNLAIIGHLHHGKTSFVDCLVDQTHGISKDLSKKVCLVMFIFVLVKNVQAEGESSRYTDNSQLERDRGISVKAMPLSLVLPNTKGKSYLVNIMDAPGRTR